MKLDGLPAIVAGGASSLGGSLPAVVSCAGCMREMIFAGIKFSSDEGLAALLEKHPPKFR